MNRIFKTLWSDTLQTWIAVSELAKGKSKNTASRPTPLVAATIITTSIFAQSNTAWSAEWVAGTGDFFDDKWMFGPFPISPFSSTDRIINNDGHARLSGDSPIAGSTTQTSLWLGDDNSGSLTVEAGGDMTVTTQTILGNLATASGFLNVTGTNSQYSTDSLYVGNRGDGEVNITDGGSLSSNYAFIGNETGSSGLVNIDGDDSSWTNAGDLTVGNNGGGELNVTNGGSVTNSGDLFLAYQAGSSGIINIDGADSILTVAGRSYIGRASGGELHITNGGTFINDNQLTFASLISDSSGLVTVDGAGSLLRADGIYVNQRGDSQLRVTDGGQVIANHLNIESENHVWVDGLGSSLENTGTINIGILSDDNSLTVSNGASVSATRFRLGSSYLTSSAINIGAARGETAVGAGTLTGTVSINYTSSLVLNHTETNYQLSSDISGASNHGQVDLLAGTTRFTGDLTGYHGTLTTDGGILDIHSGDTLALGGDYTQTNAGVLSLGVADESTFGRLTVDGTATFASNAAINVDVTDPNFAFSTDQLEDVVTAGTLVSDGTFSVTDNSFLFDFSAILDGNSIDLSLQTASSLLSQMTNPATFGAALTLDNMLASEPSSEMAAEFVSLSTQQQVAGAVESVLPAMSGAIAQATTDIVDSFSRVVDSRQAASTNKVLTDKHVWFTPFGSWAEQDRRHRVTGYDIDNHGLALGADTHITDSLNVGMAVSYIDSKLDSRAGSGSQAVKVDSYFARLFSTKTLDENMSLKLKAGMGLSDYDSRRIIFNGDVAKADYDSWHTQLGAELARRFNLSDATSVSPYLFTDYTYVKVDDYRESGSTLFSLDVEDDSADSLLMGLGVRTNHILANDWSVGLNASVGYDAMADRSDLTAAFAGGGAQFKTRGIKPAKWQYDAGLSARYQLNNGTDISAGYNITTRHGYKDEYANVTLRVLF